jgi:hypothetical protein
MSDEGIKRWKVGNGLSDYPKILSRYFEDEILRENIDLNHG